MAEVLGAAIISAATAAEVGATIGVSAAAVTTGVGALAILTGGVALNAISSSLSADPNKVAAQQFSTRQPLPSRTISFGTVKIAGPYVQYRSVGSFKYAIYHGEGPWDSYQEFWLDDIRTNLGAGSLGGVVTSVPWRNYVVVEAHLGTLDQAVSAPLLGTAGWDAQHNLFGCAYSVVVSGLPSEKKFKAYYPKQSWPTLRVVGRATLVRSPYNPASFAWSDRAGPCIFHALTDQKWGLRLPVDLMDLPSWQSFSSLCDESVVDKSGTPHPRYFLGGTHNLTDDWADTLTAMLGSCDGELYLTEDGKIGVRGGRPPVAGFTISDEMVVSMHVESSGPLLVSFNRLKPSFTSPHHDYQQTEGQPWDDLNSQAQLDGELLEEDFSRPWVQDFNQVRRLAKIAMEKGNPEYVLTLVTNLKAAEAVFEEAVNFASAKFPLFAGLLFVVKRSAIDVRARTCKLELHSLDPICYSFNSQTEEGTAPVLPNTDAPNTNVNPPVNLRVTIERHAVSGNNNATFLRVTADRPAGRDDLSLLARYRMTGDSSWLNAYADTDETFSLTSSVLVDGGLYEVEGAVTTYGQAYTSSYVAAAGSPVVAVSDPNPPDPPSGLTATPSGGTVTLNWTDSESVNVAAANLYRDGVYVKRVAAGPGTSGSTTDVPNAGDHKYTVRDSNASGAESADSNVAQVTLL